MFWEGEEESKERRENMGAECAESSELFLEVGPRLLYLPRGGREYAKRNGLVKLLKAKKSN